MSIIYTIKKHKVLFFISVLLIILSIYINSINIITIPISVYVLYEILKNILNNKLFNSKFLKISIIFFCYVILLQCTVLLAWLINNNFPLDYTTLLLLSFLIITCFYNEKVIKYKPEKINNDLKKINIQDIISILVAIFIVAIIALPPLYNTNNSNRLSVFLISNTSSSSDDSSHMMFLNDNIQFNIGVIHKSYAENHTRGSGFYPSTWSAVSAVFVKTFNSKITAGKDTLIAYLILKLFWIFVLSFFITRISFGITNYFNKNKLRYVSIFSSTIISTLFCYLFVVPFSMEGAYSFIPQIISIIILIPLLIQFGFEKSKESFPLVIIFGIGGCLAWFLSLPAFFMAIVAIAVYISANKMAEITFRNIYKLIKYCLPLTFIVIIAIVIQFLLITLSKSSDSVSLINGLLLEGSRTAHSEIYYLFYFIGFIIFYLSIKQKKSKCLYPILFLITSLLCYVGFIFTIQNCALNKSQYYYFKLFDVLLCVLVPICISGFVISINRFSKQRGRITEILISIILVMLLFQILDRDTGYRLYYLGGSRTINNKISKIIIDELSNNSSIKNYYKKEYTIFYTSPNAKIQNKHSSKFLRNKPLSKCNNQLEIMIYSSSSINELLKTIKDECSGYNIKIITDKTSYDYFQNTINSKKLSENVKLELKL